MRISDAEAPTLSFNRGHGFHPGGGHQSRTTTTTTMRTIAPLDKTRFQRKAKLPVEEERSLHSGSNTPIRRHADTPIRRHADTSTRSPDVPLPLGFQMKKMFFKRPGIRFSCNGQNWNH
jgi:hypothetical protein